MATAMWERSWSTKEWKALEVTASSMRAKDEVRGLKTSLLRSQSVRPEQPWLMSTRPSGIRTASAPRRICIIEGPGAKRAIAGS